MFYIVFFNWYKKLLIIVLEKVNKFVEILH